MANYYLKTGSYTGDGNDDRNITGVGFQPHVVFIQGNGTTDAVYSTASMSGDTAGFVLLGRLPNKIQSMISDGFQVGTHADVNSNGSTYYYTAIRFTDGASGDESSYTGNGVDDRNITAGSGFLPTWVMIQGGANNPVWKNSASVGEETMVYGGGLDFIATDAIQTLNSTGFQLGTKHYVNANATVYYHTSLKSLSTPNWRVKTGTYTGNGVDNTDINIGFQPAMVIVKRAKKQDGAHWKIEGMGATSYDVAGGSAINGIKAFNSTGFRVGTNVTTNASATTYWYVAISALLEKSKSITSDSYIKVFGKEGSLTSDCYIKVLGVTKSVTSDYYVKVLGKENSITSDYHVKVLGVVKSLTSNCYVKVLGVTKSVTSIYNVKVLGKEGSLTSDCYIKVLGVTKSITSNYNVKVLGVTESITSDYNIKVLGIAKSITSNYSVKVLDVTKSVTSDYYVKVLGKENSITSDGHVKVLGVVKSLTSDCYIKVLDVESTLTSDYYVKQLSSRSITQDAKITRRKRVPRGFQRINWDDGIYDWRATYNYTDGRIEFWYSTDQVTWTENTNARIICTAYGSPWSVIFADFSGTGAADHIEVAYRDGDSIKVRKSTGTFPGTAWGFGTENTVFTGGAGVSYYMPSINHFADGKLLVSAAKVNSNYMCVVTNTSVNAHDTSSWTGEVTVGASTNTDFSSVQTSFPSVLAGCYYTLWSEGTALKGRYYNGSSFLAEESFATASSLHTTNYHIFFGVAKDHDNADSVHIMYYTASNTTVLRTNSDVTSTGNWGSEKVVDNTGTPPLYLCASSAESNVIYIAYGYEILGVRSIYIRRAVSPYTDWSTLSSVPIATYLNSANCNTSQTFALTYEDDDSTVFTIFFTSYEDLTSDYYLKHLGYTKTLLSSANVLKGFQIYANSDSYIKKSDSEVLVSNYMIFVAGQEGSLTCNYSVLGTSSVDICSDFYVGTHPTQTITQEGYIGLRISKTLGSDYIIKTDYSKTMLQDAYILHSSYFALMLQNARVKATYSKTLTQSVYIKRDQLSTITSDYHIFKVISKTITQDVEITTIPTKSIPFIFYIKVLDNTVTITSDYRIEELQDQALVSDYFVKATDSSTITQDFYVQAVIDNSISSDYHVKATVGKTITSDSLIVIEYTQTISSNYMIYGTLTKTIVSNYSVETEGDHILYCDYWLQGVVTPAKSFTTGTVSVGQVTKDPITTTPLITAPLVAINVTLRPTSVGVDTHLRWKATIRGTDYYTTTVDIGKSPDPLTSFRFVFNDKPTIFAGETITISQEILQGQTASLSICATDATGWNTHLQEHPEMTFEVEWPLISEYYLKSLGSSVTIDSQAYIGCILVESISSDAHIRRIEEKNLNVSYYIKQLYSQILTSDALLVIEYLNTLASDYHIKIHVQESLPCDYTVFNTITPSSLTSDFVLMEVGNWAGPWEVTTIFVQTVTITSDMIIKGVGTIPTICDGSYVNKPTIYGGQDTTPVICGSST